MSDTDALPGERHAETPRDGRRINRRHMGIGIFGVAIIVAAFFVFRSPGDQKEKVENQPPRIGGRMRAFEPAKLEPAKVQPVNVPQPVSTKPSMQQLLLQDQASNDPLAKARQAPLVAANQERPAVQMAGGPMEAAKSPDESELASKLKPTLLEGTKATLLPHPEMTVTMGTLIPCTLQTAVDSSAPGMVTCITQADVLGSTGSVVLMERGTKIVGEYSSRMRQGQTRLFVLWNRAETPKHVVITLGSPAADAIGTAGFDGEIDNHFWKRFGGALLITMIDNAFGTGTALASKSGSTLLNFNSGENTATEALRNTVNIPPTLHKNQGENVAVMVARDMDFSDVYGLTMRAN